MNKALFVAAITNAESIRSCHVPDFSNPAQGPDPCQLASEPRYRKGPAACFDNNSHVSAFNQTWMMFSPFFKNWLFCASLSSPVCKDLLSVFPVNGRQIFSLCLSSKEDIWVLSGVLWLSSLASDMHLVGLD